MQQLSFLFSIRAKIRKLFKKHLLHFSFISAMMRKKSLNALHYLSEAGNCTRFQSIYTLGRRT